MLREVGKRDEKALESFLATHHPVMLRVTPRYAIERSLRANGEVPMLNVRKKQQGLAPEITANDIYRHISVMTFRRSSSQSDRRVWGLPIGLLQSSSLGRNFGLS